MFLTADSGAATLYQTLGVGGVYHWCMTEYADEYNQRKCAGEAAGDILAEEARLAELGLSYPLNLMHMLYYEGSGEPYLGVNNELAGANSAYGEEVLL